MPIPRRQIATVKRIYSYQTSARSNCSLNELDDYCLSKIIGYALGYASMRDDEDSPSTGDNGRAERNLSLVCRRWYHLTQMQAQIHGVHRVYLTPKVTTMHAATLRRPDTVFKRNLPIMLTHTHHNRRRSPIFHHNSSKHSGRSSLTNHHTTSHDTRLLRAIRPKLLKYNHLIFEGRLSCSDLRVLINAIDSARIELLQLDLSVERDATTPDEFANMPRTLSSLRKLVLFWNTDAKSDLSNGLTWTIYKRAINLQSLELYLKDDKPSVLMTPGKASNGAPTPTRKDAIERIAKKYMRIESFHIAPHTSLTQLIYKRGLCDEWSTECQVTSLMKAVVTSEQSIQELDTNDGRLIEHLIECSKRVCTTNTLRRLQFLRPITCIELLSRIIMTSSLGTDHLAVALDNDERLDEVRAALDCFRSRRHERSVCVLRLYLRDQKTSNLEDKVKNLIHLSRLTDLMIYIIAQNRVSIDCCHLMWSVGRALQVSIGQNGMRPSKGCLFRVLVQSPPAQMYHTEITVPFGQCGSYKINARREDIARRREIMRSVKKDCYHSFVKSVRDNIVS